MVKSLNLYVSYALQKINSIGISYLSNRKVCLLGGAAILICALTTTMAPSLLYSSEKHPETSKNVVPQIESTQNSRLAYETHLPKEIYQVCLKERLIDENNLKNVREQQNSNGAHHLRIEVTVDRKKGQFVLIDYFSEKATDDFRGIQVCYRNQVLMGYAVFDEEGRDYVALAPFSKGDEIKIANFILDKIFPIFKKID